MNTTTCTVNNGGPSTADSGSAVNDRFNKLVANANHRSAFVQEMLTDYEDAIQCADWEAVLRNPTKRVGP